MPTSQYDSAFGGKRGSAAKAKRKMHQHYGKDKGEQVFYATKNKNRSQQKQRGDREQLMEAFRRHAKRRKGRGR